jgi:hypothetical protein
MAKETSLASLRTQNPVESTAKPNTKPSLHDSEGPADAKEQPAGIDVAVMLGHHKVKAKHHQKMANHHNAIADEHEKMAAHHQKQHEDLTKEAY